MPLYQTIVLALGIVLAASVWIVIGFRTELIAGMKRTSTLSSALVTWNRRSGTTISSSESSVSVG